VVKGTPNGDRKMVFALTKQRTPLLVKCKKSHEAIKSVQVVLTITL